LQVITKLVSNQQSTYKQSASKHKKTYLKLIKPDARLIEYALSMLHHKQIINQLRSRVASALS